MASARIRLQTNHVSWEGDDFWRDLHDTGAEPNEPQNGGHLEHYE